MGNQKSVRGRTLVEKSLAFVHHCNRFARKDFESLFRLNATGARCKKHTELASREPHRAIGAEDESPYSLSRFLNECGLLGFWLALYNDFATHTFQYHLMEPFFVDMNTNIFGLEHDLGAVEHGL